MFAYCANNPVNCSDQSGCRPIWERNYGNGLVEYTDAGTGRYVSFPEPIVIPSVDDPTGYNCLAYSISEPTWTNLGDLSGLKPASMNVDDVAAVYIADVHAKGWDIIEVSGPNYRLHEQYGEYLVALRTGKDDYHFMVYKDGIWTQKCGALPVTVVLTDNPASCDWNKPAYYSDYYGSNGYFVLLAGYYKNYYDSKTVFFAITPN